MKKISFLTMAAFIGIAVLVSSCQKDLAVDEMNELKAGKIPVLVVEDADWLSAELVDDDVFPYEAEGWWYFRVDFTIDPDGAELPEAFNIQGGLTAGCELAGDELAGLVVRKGTKKNLVIQGGPVEAVEGGMTYSVWFKKQISECGPQELTGLWTVKWTEPNVWVDNPDGDELTDDSGYYNIEHVIGNEDPLFFEAFACEVPEL